MLAADGQATSGVRYAPAAWGCVPVQRPGSPLIRPRNPPHLLATPIRHMVHIHCNSRAHARTSSQQPAKHMQSVISVLNQLLPRFLAIPSPFPGPGSDTPLIVIGDYSGLRVFRAGSRMWRRPPFELVTGPGLFADLGFTKTKSRRVHIGSATRKARKVTAEIGQDEMVAHRNTMGLASNTNSNSDSGSGDNTSY
ncbi:hypothetical protein BDW22DRAFT_902872 [Trametopsis cervina]|nr:hypothetical protein BDW22DRAFT_902872 [Trametopsis cervina]